MQQLALPIPNKTTTLRTQRKRGPEPRYVPYEESAERNKLGMQTLPRPARCATIQFRKQSPLRLCQARGFGPSILTTQGDADRITSARPGQALGRVFSFGPKYR